MWVFVGVEPMLGRLDLILIKGFGVDDDATWIYYISFNLILYLGGCFLQEIGVYITKYICGGK